MEDTLFRTLGKSVARDMVHMWLVDTLATTAGAGEQAAQFSGTALNNPTRSTNLVEHVNLDFGVTDAQRAVDHYGFGDRFAYEQMKALKSWRNFAESEILRSSGVSGASGTAPTMIRTVLNVTRSIKCAIMGAWQNLVNVPIAATAL